ncbi:hypothetical protein C806_00194 [Lachnospiraceae bacterium 3-1]|nr:hypothetical protein C806_00194 [Lachnospiraceae bacterium 3-1]
MTALSILDVKEFMNIFLRTDTFDSFLLLEGSITTCMTYLLDGHAKADFFSPEDAPYSLASQEPYIPFSFVRPVCFDIIKGKRTPSTFKFVFQLSSENQKRTIASINSNFSSEDISGMYLNLKYQNQQLTCTTGVSYHMFSMDKSLEHAWDDMVKLFFRKHKIAFETLS